jgi:hypothetical protein
VTKEIYIEEKVCEFAKWAGWLVRKLQRIGRLGAPDRFFARGGRIVLVEFKQLGLKPEPHQEREIARLMDAGVEVYVVDSIQTGKTIFA